MDHYEHKSKIIDETIPPEDLKLPSFLQPFKNIMIAKKLTGNVTTETQLMEDIAKVDKDTEIPKAYRKGFIAFRRD